MYVQELGVAATIWGLVLACTVYAQAWRLWRVRAAKELSVSYVLASLVSFAIWSLYGWSKNDWPLIVANGLAMPGAIAVLSLRVRYRQK